MSAFLGPIHHWLYNKIQIQQAFVEEIIRWNEENKVINTDLRSMLNERYGETETRPLEEIIDESNIHGWLQERVSQVEYKLAEVVTLILKQDADLFGQLEMIFARVGEEKGLVGDSTMPVIYKNISDYLLDGMPCDHANRVLVENELEVVWRRETCVHEEYWAEVGGDVSNYYKLRESFINGVLKESNAYIEKIDEVTSKLRRKN
jgi:hypothetical protein